MDNNQFNDLSAIFDKLRNKDNSSQKQTADNLMSGLNQQQTQELKEIMSDKEKIDSILNSPAAKEIMKKINGNNDGQHK